MIGGISVHGVRMILTYPVGSMYGNDKPVKTVTDE
jgi:hypothetical protein